MVNFYSYIVSGIVADRIITIFMAKTEYCGLCVCVRDKREGEVGRETETHTHTR